MARARAARRGYTMIEVVMALGFLALTVSAVVMLQKVTLIGNSYARSYGAANIIAQGWAEKLRTDVRAWNAPSNAASDINDTTWVKQVGAGWFIPATTVAPNNGVLTGASTADTLGADLFAGDVAPAAFCTQIQLTLMNPYSKLVRAEIVVSWNAGIGVQPCTAATPTYQHTGTVALVTTVEQNSAN